MAVLLLFGREARAQDEADTPKGGVTEPPSEEEKEAEVSPPEKAENTIAGEFTPGRGFDLLKSSLGSINVSVYALIRYLNQMPGEQTFRDHLGHEHEVVALNELNWHRTFLWVSGFFW